MITRREGPGRREADFENEIKLVRLSVMLKLAYKEQARLRWLLWLNDIDDYETQWAQYAMTN